MVKTLILADTGSGNFSGNPQFIRGVPLDVAQELALVGYEEYLRKHMESEFIFSRALREREPERFKQMVSLKLSNPPPLRCYLRHVIARQMHETTDRLGEIKVPTLILIGDQDTLTVNTGNHFEGARVLLQRIPGAKMEVIKGSAHGIFWEQPEECNRIVRDFILARP